MKGIILSSLASLIRRSEKNIKSDFIKPVTDLDHYDVYHIFNVRHPKRDALREYLLKHAADELKTNCYSSIALLIFALLFIIIAKILSKKQKESPKT